MQALRARNAEKQVAQLTWRLERARALMEELRELDRPARSPREDAYDRLLRGVGIES